MISELEAGKKTDTTGQVLRRLGQTLGVTVDYLVGMYDEMETKPEDGASELWTAAVA